MLSLAWGCLLTSIICAVFGFGGIASTVSSGAQILFYVFLGLFILALLRHVIRKGDPFVHTK